MKSQTVYQGNLYTYNKYMLNPAYAGSEEYLSAILSYRNASLSIQGAPKQLMFGFHLPVFEKMGLGGKIENQTEGLFNSLTGFIDYSYNVNLGYEQRLRFGISIGLKSIQLDNSKIIATDPTAIIETASTYILGTAFESAAGIVYNWKNVELSFSAPRLFDINKKFKPNFATNLFYSTRALDNKLLLKPNVQIIYKPNIPLIYSAGITANWREKFNLGVGYLNRPGVVLSTGFSFANLNLNYAAEIATKKYANIFNTIHEISLTYKFIKVKKTPSDSLDKPPLDILVKNDPIKTDSLINDDFSDNVHVSDSSSYVSDTDSLLIDTDLTAKQDSVNNGNEDVSIVDENPYFVVEEVGDGIYALRPFDTIIKNIDEVKIDSLLKIGEIYVDDVSDSLGEIATKSGKYEIIEASDGIFELKTNIADIQNQDISDKVVDSLLTTEDFYSVIDSKTKHEDKGEVYYTLRIFIKSNSDILLKDSSLAELMRVEKSSSGKINYYLGKFSEEYSAEQVGEYLKGKGISQFEIIRIGVD